VTSTPLATRSASLSPRRARAWRRERTLDVLIPSALVASAAFVYTHGLHTWANYDDGVYLGSLDALQHGQRLGSAVFASQPPGWYLLLRAVAFVFGDSVTGVRTGLLVVALLGLVGAYACGRTLAGPLGALAAAGGVAIAPAYGGFAATVEADPAAVAFALIALALAAFAYRERTQPHLAACAGAAVAFAVSVKLLAAVAVLPIAGLALAADGTLRRRLVPLAAGAAVVVVAFVAGYARRLGSIWSDAFAMHASAYGDRRWHGHLWNAGQIADFFDPHVPAAGLVAAGIAAGVALLAVRRLRPRIAALWLFAATAVAFVVAVRPLFDHHLVVLAAGLSVPAGVTLGAAFERTRAAVPAAAAVALVVAAGLYQEIHRIDNAKVAEPPQIRRAVEALRRSTRTNQLVATDEPIVAFLARRPLPGPLVDTSYARFSSGSLTDTRVLHVLARNRIATVVAARAFLSDARIERYLHKRFGAPRTFDGVELYSR
jgi:4-amino-4-deoxy-L-arabinose transferase-like glycosyltransferase